MGEYVQLNKLMMTGSARSRFTQISMHATKNASDAKAKLKGREEQRSGTTSIPFPL